MDADIRAHLDALQLTVAYSKEEAKEKLQRILPTLSKRYVFKKVDQNCILTICKNPRCTFKVKYGKHLKRNETLNYQIVLRSLCLHHVPDCPFAPSNESIMDYFRFFDECQNTIAMTPDLSCLTSTTLDVLSKIQRLGWKLETTTYLVGGRPHLGFIIKPSYYSMFSSKLAKCTVEIISRYTAVGWNYCVCLASGDGMRDVPILMVVTYNAHNEVRPQDFHLCSSALQTLRPRMVATIAQTHNDGAVLRDEYKLEYIYKIIVIVNQKFNKWMSCIDRLDPKVALLFLAKCYRRDETFLLRGHGEQDACSVHAYDMPLGPVVERYSFW